MKRSNQANALVEMVLGLWIIGLSLSMMMWVFRAVDQQMAVNQVLRLGLRLKSVPGVRDDEVKQQMQQRLKQGQAVIFPFKETAAAQFFNLKKIQVNYAINSIPLHEYVVVHEGGEE